MKKKSFLVIAVLCLALLFTATVVACTGDDNTDETPGNTDVTPGGDDVTPGGDDVTPGGDDVTPGGDDTGITPEGEFTFTDLGNNQWSVAKYNGNRAHVKIPSTYNGGDVVEIGDNAFSGCIGLTSVVIPDSVTTIGANAFADCYGLISVKLGDSVTTIEDYAFDQCYGLISIEIPALLTTIGNCAFEDCYKLIEVYNKSDLNITAGSEDNGYVGCYAKNVHTEEGGSRLTHTDDKYIFYYNGTDAYLMGYCGDEINLILPDSFTAYNGEEIASYKIHMAAFAYNSKITSVVISDAVYAMGEAAFACPSLISITIGKSVTEMDEMVFGDCFKLIEVYNKSNLDITVGGEDHGCVGLFAKNVYTEEGGSKLSYTDDGYIFYYDGTEGYLVGYNGDETELTLPDSFTAYDGTTIDSYEIYQYAFADYYAFGNYDLMKSVDISDSVTAIGYCSFGWCDSLASVTLGKSLKVIGEYAFAGCCLTSVVIPDSVTTIGAYAFTECRGLLSVTIGESVKTIGYRAFFRCYKLIEVYDRSRLLNIAADFAKNVYTEEGGSKLSYNDDGYIFYYDGTEGYFVGYNGDETELTLPDSFTAYDGTKLNSYGIYRDAFYSCTELTSVVIPDSVSVIESRAFYDCVGLTSVEIPDSVITIGGYAFASCTGLTSLEIPDSVTTIEYNAFEDCINLTSVTLGESVTTIGSSAFDGCYNLTSVTFKDTEGWQVSTSESFDQYVSLSSTDLADPATAEQYLTSNYCRYYWRKV